MNTFSTSKAKANFCDLLLKAHISPVQITKNGKSVAVVMSAAEYEDLETLKLQLLQARATQAKADIKAGNLTDGDTFFDELESGKYD